MDTIIRTFLDFKYLQPDVLAAGFSSRMLPYNKAIVFASINGAGMIGFCIALIFAGVCSLFIENNKYHSVFLADEIFAFCTFLYCLKFIAFKQQKLINLQLSLIRKSDKCINSIKVAKSIVDGTTNRGTDVSGRENNANNVHRNSTSHGNISNKDIDNADMSNSLLQLTQQRSTQLQTTQTNTVNQQINKIDILYSL